MAFYSQIKLWLHPRHVNSIQRGAAPRHRHTLKTISVETKGNYRGIAALHQAVFRSPWCHGQSTLLFIELKKTGMKVPSVTLRYRTLHQPRLKFRRAATLAAALPFFLLVCCVRYVKGGKAKHRCRFLCTADDSSNLSLSLCTSSLVS